MLKEVAEAFPHITKDPGINSANVNADPKVVRLIREWQRNFKENDYQNALRVVAEGRMQIGGLKALVEANIGVTYDQKGAKVLDQQEEQRLRIGKRAAEDIAAIVEGKITQEILNRYRPIVENIIRQNPYLNAVYAQLNDNEKVEFVRRLLLDKKTATTIIASLGEQGHDLLKLPIDDDVEPLRRELEDLRAEKARLENEQQATQQAAEDARIALSEFRAIPSNPQNPGSGLREGQYVIRLRQLRSQESTFQSVVDSLKLEINQIDEQILELLRAQTGAMANVSPSLINISIGGSQRVATIAEVQKRIDELKVARRRLLEGLTYAQNFLSEAQAEIKTITDHQTQFETELRQAESTLASIESRIRELAKQIREKEYKYFDARTKRQIAEDKFIKSLTAIIPEAVAATINEKIDALITQQVEIDKANIEAAKSELERSARQAIFNRYFDANGEPNWANFDVDWRDLIQHGEVFVMQRILGQTQYNDLLHRDKDFLETLTSEYKKKMFHLRNARPGRLPLTRRRWSRNEIMAFVNRFSDEELQQALSDRTIQNAIDQALGSGSLRGNERLRARLSKLPMKELLLVLAILIGSGVILSMKA